MVVMMMDEFEVRSYGWQELAVLYGPDLMPASAGKRLCRYIAYPYTPRLHHWRTGAHDKW